MRGQLHATRLFSPPERPTPTADNTWRWWLSRWWLGASLPLFLLSLFSLSAAQTPNYAREARLDEKGDIYVSSDDGRSIWMANTRHCAETTFAKDRQTVLCAVFGPVQDQKPVPILQLEVYSRGGRKQTIEPGHMILEWHFWKDGQQAAVYFAELHGQGTHALYESATGRLVEQVSQPKDERLLPQWAKSRAQINDESVPMSPFLAQDRTMWVSKVLRQIGKIEPGMRRRDLATIFTTEGGMSNRFQRTYVYFECPYIKVNIRFKATNGDGDALREDPEDIIESVSPPYLAWAVMD